MKILVVDDSSAQRAIIKRQLMKIGYTETFEAEDGMVALDIISREAPDYMITDINMPNMDGIELAQKIVEQKFTLKYGFLSSNATDSSINSAKELGASFYITKPFKWKDFRETVIDAFGKP